MKIFYYKKRLEKRLKTEVTVRAHPTTVREPGLIHSVCPELIQAARHQLDAVGTCRAPRRARCLVSKRRAVPRVTLGFELLGSVILAHNGVGSLERQRYRLRVRVRSRIPYANAFPRENYPRAVFPHEPVSRWKCQDDLSRKISIESPAIDAAKARKLGRQAQRACATPGETFSRRYPWVSC